MGGEDLVLRFIGLDLLSNIASAIGGRIDSLMKSIGSSGTELGKSFANVGKVAVGMGAGLLAVSAALTAVVVGTGMAAATFEQKMTLLHTQAGATTAEVQRMTKAVLDIAPAVGFGPDKLADAMYHVESLGFRGAKALDLLTVAAKGAQIGNADLESTVNALGGVLVAEVGGVSNAAQAMAVLDATVGVGNMRMQDLVNAMSTGVVPAGKNFGLTLQEINGALATLTDNAVPADEAATRLRMTFALIGAPTRQATKELASIGISQLQLATDMRGPNGLVVALRDLHSHLVASGKSAEEQSYIITRAFGGGRSSAGIMTLLNNLDRLNQRTQQITAMTGTFGERFAERAQNANFALSQLHATFERLVILVGTAVLPVFAAVIRFMTPIITAIGTWVENHQRLTAALLIGGIVLTALGGIFLVVFGMIAVVLGGVLALIVALPMMAAAVTPILIAIGVTLGVMALLVGAIIGVVVAIQRWSQITAIAQNVWGFVGPFVIGVLNAISDAVRIFVNIVTVWWREHGEQVRLIWEGIVLVVQNAWDLIWRIVSTAITVLLPFINSAFGTIGDMIGLAWDLITSVIRVALDVILTIISVALDVLTGDWGRAWDDLRAGLGHIFDDIVRGATQFGGDLIHAIVNGVVRFGGDIGKAVETFLPGPVKKFLGIGNDAGVAISAGLAQGIASGKAAIDGAVARATASTTRIPAATGIAPGERVRAATYIPPPPPPAPEPSAVTRIWDIVVATIKGHANAITNFFTSWGRGINAFWQAWWREPAYWIGFGFGTIYFIITRALANIDAALHQWEAGAAAGIRAFVTDTIGWFSRLPGAINGILTAVGMNVVVWGIGIVRSAIASASGFVNNVSRFFGTLPLVVGVPIARVLVDVINWGGHMMAVGQQAMRDFGLAVATELYKLPDVMVQIGIAIVQGLVRGFNSVKDWAGEQIGNLVRGFRDAAIKAGLGGSPMMLFAEPGADIVRGIVVGIEGERANAAGAMDRLIGSLVTPTRYANVHAHAGGSASAPAALGGAVGATATTHAVQVNVGDDTAAAIADLTSMSDDRLTEAVRLLREIARGKSSSSGALVSQRRYG